MVKKSKAKATKKRAAKARPPASKSSPPTKTAILAKYRRLETALEEIRTRLERVDRQLSDINESHTLRERNQDLRHDALRSAVDGVANNFAILRSEFNAIRGSEPSSGDLRSRHGQLVENPPRGVDANARGELRRD
jgi:hypothetical protein